MVAQVGDFAEAAVAYVAPAEKAEAVKGKCGCNAGMLLGLHFTLLVLAKTQIKEKQFLEHVKGQSARKKISLLDLSLVLMHSFITG